MPSSMLQLLLAVSGVVVMAAVVSASDIEHRQLAATVPEAPKGLQVVEVSGVPKGSVEGKGGVVTENVNSPRVLNELPVCNPTQSACLPFPAGLFARQESVASSAIIVTWESMTKFLEIISYDLEIDGVVANVNIPRWATSQLHSPAADGKYHNYRMRSRGHHCVSQWTPYSASARLNPPSPRIPQSGWKIVSSSSSQSGSNYVHPAQYAIDGNRNSFWHTRWTPTPLGPPHDIVIDLGAVYTVDSFSYLPRQDREVNGNIGLYAFFVSTSKTDFGSPGASGIFDDTKDEKIVELKPPKAGRYIKLLAVDEAGRRGPWASVAEINVTGRRN